jgi:hypothetical protein
VIKAFTLLIVVLLSTAVSAQVRRTDITKDDIRSLKGVTSRELSVSGFFVGMTFTRAMAMLSRSKTLIGERDFANKKRIYVYERNVRGQKGASLLYLIWDESRTLKQITIFEFAGSFVGPAFRLIFGQRAVDVNSEAIRNSLGKFDREEVSLDIPSARIKHLTYHYCRAGIQITRKTHKDVESTVFALVLTQSPRACRKKY